MKSKYLFLFFIPALVYARIAIRITAGKTEADASVQYTGSDVAIISDQERESFQIGDRSLKEAWKKYFGTEPTDVFVKSPTPWEDVYHKKNWQQVQRTLKPVRARVMGIHTKPIIVSTRELVNNSPFKGTFNADIAHSVHETVSNSWLKGGELTVGQAFSYGVNFPGGSVGGLSNLSYAGNWGNETSKSTEVTIGSTSSVEVELSPGQAAVVTLSATRVTLDIEVDYEAYLTGRIFANFHNKWRHHRWWSFPIKYVMLKADITPSVNSTEKISIGFYTSARVEINDRKTNSTMMHISADIIGSTGTLPNIH